eukprot:gene5176-5414_t
MQVVSLAVRAGVLVYSARVAAHALRHARRRPAAHLTSVCSTEATAEQQLTSSGVDASEESKRTFIVVSTASIPWRTGTAVNPALRAAHLAAHTPHKVILVVPFIPVQDQVLIFPQGMICNSREQQADIIRCWVHEHSGLLSADFQVLFYSARYYPSSRCIFATEDISSLLPKTESTVVLLEEPEHLNWYRCSGRWSSEYQHVVGVLHTDYSGYAADLPGWVINKAAVGLVCRVVCRLHCHKVIQLSELAKHLARSTTCNVHGVSAKFLAVGRKGCYFLGKALWDKGHGQLMDLLQRHDKQHKQQVAVDVFGGGPDLPAIQAEAVRQGLALSFLGHADHCSPRIWQYKIFINCCKKDVLATATAEAVAMNKWVVLPEAPCNQFFKAFPNVLVFSTPAEFSQQLTKALQSDPPPLTDPHIRELSWEAATQRLLAAASISSKEWPGPASQALDDCLWVPWQLFALLFKGARRVFAAPPKLLMSEGMQKQQQGEGHWEQRTTQAWQELTLNPSKAPAGRPHTAVKPSGGA